MENFEDSISEILEVESVNMSDELESFEAWDSLTILSLIALISEDYKVELSKDEIEESNTIQGLKDLIKSKQ